jgi:hypothetical protein
VVTQFHSLKRYHPRLTMFNAWYRIFIPTHDQLLCYWWQKKIFLCPRWQFFSIQFLLKWERIGNFMKKRYSYHSAKRHFYIMFLWHLLRDKRRIVDNWDVAKTKIEKGKLNIFVWMRKGSLLSWMNFLVKSKGRNNIF